MPKPVLISLIPPVTIGGRNLPVVANLFDDSGNFRQRNGSFNRQRVEGGGAASRDGFYDLSRDATTPSFPCNPKVDVGRIRALMVKANEMATTVRARYTAGSVPDDVRDLAGFSVALLDLVNVVVEEGLLPALSSPAATSFASVAAAPASGITGNNTNSRIRGEPGTAELKAVLALAEKTAIVFDADLGQSPVTNRATLNGAFAARLRAATVKVADESGTDANESIRIVNDALSCADNQRDPANPVVAPFCSMPVKLDFPDKSTRIHFEKTLRKHCGLKASISLLFPIRKYQALFLKSIRERHAGRIVTARPDISSLTLIAFMKEEGGSGWTRCRETVPIPRGIMLPGFVIPNRVDLPVVADSIGDEDDALLVEASIGAESQP
jgi:hypothetical protein